MEREGKKNDDYQFLYVRKESTMGLCIFWTQKCIYLQGEVSKIRCIPR